MQQVPSKEDFDTWLADNPVAHPMSKEDVRAFIDRAPVSLETKDYIKKHLRDVPNSAAHLDVLTASPQVGLCVMLGKTVGLRWDASISPIICSLDQEAAVA